MYLCIKKVSVDKIVLNMGKQGGERPVTFIRLVFALSTRKVTYPKILCKNDSHSLKTFE